MSRLRSKKELKVASSYLHDVYEVEQLPKIIDRLIDSITFFCTTKRKSIDAIAFTGTSGAAAAYPLSIRLKMPLICIRKDTESSHHGLPYEGVIGIKNYIIVDDCIESGKTIKRIIKEVKLVNPKAQPIGIFLYNDYKRKSCQNIPCVCE
jgi:adenine/guanine phosphoribosyltransferase-like PRPP-binding protein